MFAENQQFVYKSVKCRFLGNQDLKKNFGECPEYNFSILIPEVYCSFEVCLLISAVCLQHGQECQWCQLKIDILYLVFT